MQRKIVITEDGSASLFVPSLQESFHSIHGALQESMYIFIDCGLKFLLQQNPHFVSIVEVGFGTGLNALLSCLYAENKNIYYHGIELYPINNEEFKLLNYADFLTFDNAKTIFQQIFLAPFGQKTNINNNFTLQKTQSSILDINLDSEKYNLIYFDAFSPDTQPEMWTNSVLEKLYYSLISNGIFITYSTKGIVKRRLKEIGFSIEKLP